MIVTSDHGEALYRRGYGNHGQGFFQDETALPLVARLPGVSPERGRVECLVGLVDLMPSLCDYLGAECPSAASGWSFVAGAEVATAQERRFLVTEGVMGRPSHRAIRDRNFKRFYEPEGKRAGPASGSPWSLYDMEEDPRERFDRADPRLATARTRGVLDRMRRALPDAVLPYAAPAATTAPVSPELEQRLESLGYLEPTSRGD